MRVLCCVVCMPALGKNVVYCEFDVIFHNNYFFVSAFVTFLII